MIAGVADTHTALWYLYDDARLSTAAGKFIDEAAAQGEQIVVSSISLAEIVYLIEKKRLPGNAYADLKSALDESDHVFKEAPFTGDIVDAMRQIARADVPDLKGQDHSSYRRIFRRACHQSRQPHLRIQSANGLVTNAVNGRLAKRLLFCRNIRLGKDAGSASSAAAVDSGNGSSGSSTITRRINDTKSTPRTPPTC